MKNVLLLGAGALGSQTAVCLAPDLRNEIDLHILDYDKVEQRNVEPGTQFYQEDQIGQLKVHALQFNLYRWFNKRVEVTTKKFTKSLQAKFDQFEELYPYLVIDTFDNYKSRKLVQDWVTNNDIECVHAGFSERITFQICWAENYTVPDDIVSDFDICTLTGAASFIKMVSSLTANSVIEFLHSGDKREFVGNRFKFREVK